MINLEILKIINALGIEQQCRRRHRIIDYEPGHVRYQFGHYPTSKPYVPDENDWRLLDLYAQKGIKVIHVWKAHDWLGLFGKELHEPVNEKGLRLFIDECHKRKLKVIPYTSPGYMDVRAPAYKKKWDSFTPRLKEVYYDLARMCPGSPGWRRCFFSSIENQMDSYGFDGIYWDSGFSIGCSNPEHDNHVHFKEFAPFKDCNFSSMDHKTENEIFRNARKDPEMNSTYELWNEFIAEIHAIVKSRGGLTVAHIGGDNESPFKEKNWDYQLLGEGRSDISASLKATRYYEPYILRFIDWSRLVTNHPQRDFTPDFSKVPDIEHHVFSASIPYMQFPWLEDGNYGENEDLTKIPGVKWKEGFDVWTEWMKAQEKAGLPPVGGASFIAGRDRYFKYLELFRMMTKPNTVSFLELKRDCKLPLSCDNDDTVISLFINDFLWAAIFNSGEKEAVISYGPFSGKQNEKSVLKPRRLAVLKYSSPEKRPELIMPSE